MHTFKSNLNKILFGLVLSVLLFFSIEVSMGFYFFISTICWLLIFLNFKPSKNIAIFETALILFSINLVSFIAVRELQDKSVLNNYVHIGLIAICLLFVIVTWIFRWYMTKNEDSGKNIHDATLIAKREKDLNVLESRLSTFPIIGLNGRWGTGKTFLVNKLRERLEDKYEIIEIDLLTCNLNEFQLTLIKELEKVMYRNRIISKHSYKLKSFFDNGSLVPTLKNFQHFIVSENTTYAETIKGFKQDLNKLQKDIIIVYEDIDRIAKEDVIKQIFSTSEKLADNNVKIIYQYDENQLKSFGFSSMFIEKYIPFRMNITEINFFEIVDFELTQQFQQNVLEINDFEFLKTYALQQRFNILLDEFKFDMDINMTFKNMSIRKVENFLDESISTIKQKPHLSEFKRMVISFFITKHFFESVYEEMGIENGLLENVQFEIHSTSYNIGEILAKYKKDELKKADIETIFNDESNCLKLLVLKLFNFNYGHFSIQKEYKGLESILDEPIMEIRDKNLNEKKDRIIWNLLASGKSEYTDYEYVGNKFIEEVLGQEDPITSYHDFFNSLFHHKEYLDNGTIFKIGVPEFLELFKAFRVMDVTADQQTELIDIYFAVQDIKSLDLKVIQNMNYCKLSSKKEYLNILSRLNQLHIKGSLNHEKSFVQFLEKYIEALTSLGYMNTKDFWHFSNKVENVTEHMLDEITKIKETLSKLERKITIKTIQWELNLIIEFLNRIIALINCNNPIINNDKGFNITEFSSHYMNQEEFDRLRTVLTDYEEKDALQEIEESYMKDSITVHEINKLLEEKNNN
ncbi:P-loop NTPase fold protein [Salibacterium salarium]|nr:P-loop NTPase fold protein [Salibacterium salarium]